MLTQEQKIILGKLGYYIAAPALCLEVADRTGVQPDKESVWYTSALAKKGTSALFLAKYAVAGLMGCWNFSPSGLGT